jgi:hypothetical protein
VHEAKGPENVLRGNATIRGELTASRHNRTAARRAAAGACREWTPVIALRTGLTGGTWLCAVGHIGC